MCARLHAGLNNRLLMEKNFTARWVLCILGCIPNHPPNDSPPTSRPKPPKRNRNKKMMQLPRIHMAARRWCKHQCTESPAPGDEEKLNIRHQVVAAVAALLPQGQCICLKNGQYSKCNFEQSMLVAYCDDQGHLGSD